MGLGIPSLAKVNGTLTKVNGTLTRNLRLVADVQTVTQALCLKLVSRAGIFGPLKTCILEQMPEMNSGFSLYLFQLLVYFVRNFYCHILSENADSDAKADPVPSYLQKTP
jgi:hypothetical protein